ncbi:YlaN family protein [Brevibacillus marinus]|uniref:YlaN family protein n=1 Tax=Brevibacillus marinus TaxID=2496837 RepID=UPI000F848662|nr:YlaN family protein [Brevibacillus marinus]
MTEVKSPDMVSKALSLLRADAEKIYKLIDVQMENLTMPQCPLYEEVLDTQMFGLSREIEFAVRLGLIDEEAGREIMGDLERKLAHLHELYNKQASEG